MAKVSFPILVLSVFLLFATYSCGGQNDDTTVPAQVISETQTTLPDTTPQTTTMTTQTNAMPTTTSSPSTSPSAEVTPTAPTSTTITISGTNYRSGFITQDEVWSGTVHITGDVTMKDGLTLTILPGTKVLFAAHQDDQHSGVAVPRDEGEPGANDPAFTLEWNQTHCGMNIYGTLIAKGTPENPIIFTSDSPTPNTGDWVLLHFGKNSIIEYCTIEYARGGLDVMENTDNSVLISHNTIRECLWAGISMHSCSPTITYNEIIHAGGHQGIDVIGEGSAPLIAHNIIKECIGGINVLDGNSPTIEYNTITDTEHPIGVSGPRTKAIIRYNSMSCPIGPSSHFTNDGEVVYQSRCLLGEQFFINGIFINNSSPVISNNEIFQCNRAGINIMGDSSPIITGNTIHQNVEGILFEESFIGTATIEMNNFFDNKKSNIKLWPGTLLTAINNWWGTTEIIMIKAKFLNIYDEPAWELVIFEPFLTEPFELE